MSTRRITVPYLGLLICLFGCGGSNSVSSSAEPGGLPFSQYQATLPDGSAMEIEILADDDRAWEGEFAVATETGPYAHQTGTFVGTATGGTLTATCQTPDGVTFDLTGTRNGPDLQLTRSDIPGIVLNFQPVTAMAPKAGRADTSFNLSIGTGTGSTGSNGRVTISTTPYSVNASMTEYRGTWLGLNVTFWSYNSGYASIVTYCNDYAVNTANFANYKLSDFATAKQSSASGRLSVYSAVTKSQFQYPNQSNVSP